VALADVLPEDRERVDGTPGTWSTRTKLVVGLLGAAGSAWFALIVWGGDRAMRLGLLTGGAVFLSMARSGMSMTGMGHSTVATGQAAVSSMHMGMPGMRMASGSAPIGAVTGVGSATSMRMTMFGLSISGTDHMLSWPVFGMFIVMWFIMIAAMMFLVLLPMSLHYHDRAKDPASTTQFVLADIAVWTLVGIPCYFALTALNAVVPATNDAALRLGAVLVALAGVYEFTALKGRAHRRCCAGPVTASPPCPTGPAAGDEPAWKSGIRHGISSLGCCGPMMGVLLLIGMMNIAWMAALTSVMVVERTVPWGPRLSRLVGVGFVGIAILLVAAPRPLPALA
jgi:predicted metal-binding membrane protein